MKQYLLLTLTSLIALIAPTHAAQSINEPLDINSFEQIPVQDNGRIKPLGTFAATKLKTFSGQKTWHDSAGNSQSAALWLAETLFNPASAAQQEIFNIQSKDLKKRLRLNLDKSLFTLQDLSKTLTGTQEEALALLQQDADTLTNEQNELLHLHENTIEYANLLRSFSMILPLNIDIPPKYGISSDTPPTLMALRGIEQRVNDDLKTIIKRKGDDITKYNSVETGIATLGFRLQQLRTAASGNNALRIIPAGWEKDDEAGNKEWFSPWQILTNGQGAPQNAAYLAAWQDMANAYRNHNAAAWETAIQNTRKTIQTIAPAQVSAPRLKAELIYQSINPYHAAMALYAISITLLIISTLTQAKTSRATFTAATWIGGTALLAHIAGIALRIYILERPPVGTLYESVLFVSAICALTAIISAIRTNKPILAITGQVAALGLLALAPVMLQKGDSLELLVAVLNTNFWLTTHVLCITAGYGACIIAASLAHMHLIKQAFGHKETPKTSTKTAISTIHLISLAALFLTAFGTVLGGIWADQSWGRFWGWDPKENGALLIVLWIIWAQHGRISGHMIGPTKENAYIATIAALNIIVALSWFGVNLLGVGLHSYGFTSGLAAGLALFCTLELLIIGTLWYLAQRRLKTA